jgi:hypothetical protein
MTPRKRLPFQGPLLQRCIKVSESSSYHCRVDAKLAESHESDSDVVLRRSPGDVAMHASKALQRNLERLNRILKHSFVAASACQVRENSSHVVMHVRTLESSPLWRDECEMCKGLAMPFERIR